MAEREDGKCAKKRTRASRMRLTIEDQQNVVDAVASNSSTHKEIGLKFGISRQAVGMIWSRRDEIAREIEFRKDIGASQQSNKRRVLTAKYPSVKVDGAVYRWIEAERQLIGSPSMKITGEVLMQKAREFAIELGINDFKASSGWLKSFNKRYERTIPRVDPNTNLLSSYSNRNDLYVHDPKLDDYIAKNGLHEELVTDSFNEDSTSNILPHCNVPESITDDSAHTISNVSSRLLELTQDNVNMSALKANDKLSIDCDKSNSISTNAEAMLCCHQLRSYFSSPDGDNRIALRLIDNLMSEIQSPSTISNTMTI